MADATTPFQPLGNTVRITAPAANAPVGVNLPVSSAPGTPVQGVVLQVRARNTGTADIALGYGATANLAQTNSAFPTAANVSVQAVTMGGGQTEVFTLPNGTYFSALSASGNVSVDLTPGTGP